MPEPLFPTGRDRSGGGPDDPAERALRRALAAQASAVGPSPAPRVGELVDRSRPRRWPAALGVAASVALLAVASAVALRPDVVPSPVPVAGPSGGPSASASVETSPSPSSDPSTQPSSGPSPAPPPSSGPTPGPTSTAPVPDGASTIVWACLADGDGTKPRVAPERRSAQLPTGTGMTDQEATTSAAVDLLDTLPPLDPDYVNYWAPEPEDPAPPGRTDVRITDSGTTVAFSGRALSGLDTGATFTCLTEALVRTVVSNGGTPPVTFLLDGEPAAFAELDFAEPARPSADLLVGGWVLDPYEGQRVPAGTVTLSGTATAFEATVSWQVLNTGGAVVAEGFTMAGSNGEYGPWTVPVDLQPGTYTAVLRAENMAGEDEGPGRWLWEDTKTFTVVP